MTEYARGESPPGVRLNGHQPTAPTSEHDNGRSAPLPAAPLTPLPPPEDRSGRDTARYRRILIFFGSIILSVVFLDLLLGRIPLVRDAVRRSRPQRSRRWAARFRVLAIDMGGVMIKLGQFLSARIDILPVEIIEELAGLQDEVPSEDPALMLGVLRRELGDLDAHYAHVEPTPLAAASLGQAHRAWLRPTEGNGRRGEAVIVKIQRPNIEQIVRTDLAALRVVARWVQRYRPIGRRADVPALMEEFAVTLWEELDYESEADNAERFAEFYADSPDVYIPAVYRQQSTRRVITLENVESIKITDVDGLRAAGIDPKQVAATMLESYFSQIFIEGFFHADPHPGNLYVRPRTDLPWQPGDGPRPFWLIFIDFGMVGRVPDLVGDNLRKWLAAITQRDAQALTESYAELGFFLPSADLDRITEAQAVVLDHIWGRQLLDLARPDPKEVQELGNEFRDLLFDFPFQIPQDFIYLGRAISMVSGLVSLLDPEINPFYFIEKFGERVIAERDVAELTLETILQRVRPYLDAPARINRVIEAAESGQLRVQSIPDNETLRHYDRLEKRLGQLAWSILGSAAMISGTVLYWLRRREDK